MLIRLKDIFTSPDQVTGRNHSMKTDNSSFEREEKFKYLETTLKNKNFI